MPATPTPAAPARPIVQAVVQQHAEESAMLRHVRSVLVRAPHVALLHLGRLDERIAAHLDGLAVAGPAGTALCVQALEHPGAGEVFAVAVRAIESRDERLFDHVLALVPALPDAARGVASALGWVSAADLQGVVRRLLASSQPHERALGLTACRMHQVDPGPTLGAALADASPELRQAALRAAGELGRIDLLDTARRAIAEDHPGIVFWAAWAACLLGDRQSSLSVLSVAAQQDSPLATAALSLVMAAGAEGQAGELARAVSKAAQEATGDMRRRRRLVRALGLLGDTRFVPWLIERMAEPALARLAGESFSVLTGADLSRLDLETLEHPSLPEMPSDDPDDDDVALDEDDSLPWPDVAKLQAWWSRQTGMQPGMRPGRRLFDGEPASAAVAARVLREGTQRRRAHAAQLACALEPGRRLFPIAAPVPRQRRWLAGTG
ncbi:MAG TPA: TIGR02270 family protein [Rubrivivax sp.]